MHRLVANKADGKMVELVDEAGNQVQEEKLDSLELEVRVFPLYFLFCWFLSPFHNVPILLLVVYLPPHKSTEISERVLCWGNEEIREEDTERGSILLLIIL